MRTILALMLFLIPIMGCTSQPKPAIRESDGEQTYKQYCANCHRLPDPITLTPERFEQTMERHKKRVKLDSLHLNRIKDFLKAVPR